MEPDFKSDERAHPSIETFLLMRAAELQDLCLVYEASDFQRLRTIFRGQAEAIRRVVVWHQNWPVLVQRPAHLERIEDVDIDRIAYRMTQDIQFLTHQEYARRFGTAPPTAPILKIMAQAFKDHKDFNPDWSDE